METLRIYTDGACSGNPGPGGWATVLIYGEKIKELSGYEPDTTNNRMELLAAIKGMEAIKIVPKMVELYSDSSYLVNAIEKGWLSSWQKNGWRTASKGSVKNQDLWERIVELNEKINPKYIWVKGHAMNKWNNRCDELAVLEIKNNR